MYYELYIDVFFLENFMMDYILLMLLKRMLSDTASHGRIVLGAAVGAAMTCMIVVLPIPYMFVKTLLFHAFVNVVMLKTGLKIKGRRSFFKAFLFLYLAAILLGGIMESLSQYIRIGSLFFVLALAGYFLALGIWNLTEALIRYNRTHCRATLYKNGKSCEVRVLVDTGNRLKDGVTEKPVSIISRRSAETLGFSEHREDSEKFRYIPYHSIGNAAGVLPLFEIDKMHLSGQGKDAQVDHPLLAVCGDEMDSDDYELILNPDIYIGGNEEI